MHVSIMDGKGSTPGKYLVMNFLRISMPLSVCRKFHKTFFDAAYKAADKLARFIKNSDTWGHIFNRVQPFYEWAVSNLDP